MSKDYTNTPNEVSTSPIYDEIIESRQVSMDVQHAISGSPIFDAMREAYHLAATAKKVEYSVEFLENGRNRLVEAMGVQNSPGEEPVDSFLDREFGIFGLIHGSGRHIDAGQLNDGEKSVVHEQLYFKHIFEIGSWLDYARKQEAQSESKYERPSN